ncbi:hypothetical protein [Actinoplanes sp. NPDC049681]|uniref:hypothetical protein n=1 Tax=Actinoplanes sp. NPDC049681 TaxID=3363905 RepID=UPI003794DB86
MRGRPIAWGLIAVAALAGCSSPDVSPIDSTIPTPSGPVASRSLPPVAHKWSVAAVKCPELTVAAAQQLKVGGRGTQTRSTGSDDFSKIVECRWGPEDRSATSVTAKLSVWADQAGADAGWQTVSTALVKPEPLAGVGEEAFVSRPLDLRGVQVDVRTGNAYVTIHLIPAAGAAGGDAELREAAAAIAGDVIDDLVPA